jgi:formylglycine-generating enzyme required for sulfatase activity
MPGKIFVSYRRDDVAGDARGIFEQLAGKFGRGAVFMDVDNLLAGQRFDRELAKALDACDVLIAVIGPRWMELLEARSRSGERDYVREEIAAALQRGIVVIPVRVGSDGHLPPLPRRETLPGDIRDLVLHQKHDVTHERFGRDMAELATAIGLVRRGEAKGVRVAKAPLGWMAAGAVLALGLAWAGAYWLGLPVGGPRPAETVTRQEEEARRDPALTVKPGSGQSFRDCPECPEMVVVPAGSFTMGSPANEQGRDSDEGPQHQVAIRQSFAVGKFEVTFAEWEACVAGGGCTGNSNPNEPGWGKGRRPVINVSWVHAKEYVDWLARKTGKSYRLLSEAEWEYAARAGSGGRWTFGDNESQLGEFGWYSSNSGDKTQPVGGKKPNAWGLHDMHGNVWEWVEDCWHDSYNGAPSDGSARTTACTDSGRRVVRGGSWLSGPLLLRSANRDGNPSDDRGSAFGFRVGRTF